MTRMVRFGTVWMALACAAAQAQDSGLAARSLAATCANCHGTNGQARAEMPALAGRPAAEIVAAFTEFKNGSRAATVMHQIAKGYTDEQVRLLAGWFAAQPAR
jgi:cytochrome subunit of sulfide dehydrogenase